VNVAVAPSLPICWPRLKRRRRPSAARSRRLLGCGAGPSGADHSHQRRIRAIDAAWLRTIRALYSLTSQHRHRQRQVPHRLRAQRLHPLLGHRPSTASPSGWRRRSRPSTSAGSSTTPARSSRCSSTTGRSTTNRSPVRPPDPCAHAGGAPGRSADPRSARGLSARGIAFPRIGQSGREIGEIVQGPGWHGIRCERCP
jgi:hypothetical protein